MHSLSMLNKTSLMFPTFNGVIFEQSALVKAYDLTEAYAVTYAMRAMRV